MPASSTPSSLPFGSAQYRQHFREQVTGRIPGPAYALLVLVLDSMAPSFRLHLLIEMSTGMHTETLVKRCTSRCYMSSEYGHTEWLAGIWPCSHVAHSLPALEACW